jgi:hypothetical protein
MDLSISTFINPKIEFYPFLKNSNILSYTFPYLDFAISVIYWSKEKM